MWNDLVHGVALGRIFAEHFRYKVFGFGRYDSPVLRIKCDLLPQNIVLRLVWIYAEEGEALSEDRVKHDTQTPNICLLVVISLANDLWRWEGQTATRPKDNLPFENNRGKAEI
jgi:hypothetical protein